MPIADLQLEPADTLVKHNSLPDRSGPPSEGRFWLAFDGAGQPGGIKKAGGIAGAHTNSVGGQCSSCREVVNDISTGNALQKALVSLLPTLKVGRGEL